MEIAKKMTSAACTSLGHALQTGSSSGDRWSTLIQLPSSACFRANNATDSGEKFELICLWSRRWVTKGHGTEDGVPAGQGAYRAEARFARFSSIGRGHEWPLFHHAFTTHSPRIRFPLRIHSPQRFGTVAGKMSGQSWSLGN